MNENDFVAFLQEEYDEELSPRQTAEIVSSEAVEPVEEADSPVEVVDAPVEAVEPAEVADSPSEVVEAVEADPVDAVDDGVSQWMSVNECADILEVSPNTMRKILRADGVPCLQLLSKIRVPRVEFEALVDRHFRPLG